MKHLYPRRIYKYILTLVIVLPISINAWACDGCNLYEYANLNNRSFFSISYRYRLYQGYFQPYESQSLFGSTFRTLHDPGNSGMLVGQTPKDYERYQTVELRANKHIGKGFNLSFVLPIRSSTVYYKEVYLFPSPLRDSSLSTTGIGDIIVMMEYVKRFEIKRTRHFIKPMLGLKAPTGQYQKMQQNKILAYDLQPGLPVWETYARLGYTLTYRRWGWDTWAGTWMALGESKNRVKPGSRSGLQTQVFRTIELGLKTFVTLRCGYYGEWVGQDVFNDVIQERTGGNIQFGMGGVDVTLGRLTWQVSYQHPVYQKLNQDMLMSQGRWLTSIMYTFGNTKSED